LLVVDFFDEGADLRPGFHQVTIGPAVDFLLLERLHEALRHRRGSPAAIRSKAASLNDELACCIQSSSKRTVTYSLSQSGGALQFRKVLSGLDADGVRSGPA
jgi:hypothetical protein